MKRWLLLSSLAIVGCGTNLSVLPNGDWGGQHVDMKVTGGGATLNFDCAHGSIDVPLDLDDHGSFDVNGVYVRESGVPRPGDTDVPLPARYAGTTDGQLLEMTVTVIDGSTPSRGYRLNLNRPAVVTKCP